MKQALFISLFLIFGWKIGTAENLNTTSLEDIIAGHIEAMGGKAHWQKLQTYAMHQSRENDVEVSTYARKPDAFKIHARVGENERFKVYDGEEGFNIRNGQYEAMRPGEEIEMKEEPEFYEELLFADEEGHELQFLGMEKVEGVNCYHLNLIKSPEDQQQYWLNENSFLIEMTGEYSQDPAHEGIYYTTRFMDYRSVEGWLFPFRLKLRANQDREIEMNYERIEVNPIFPSDFFSYEANSTVNWLKFRRDQHADDHLPGFAFTQETIRFDKDGNIRDTSIWYETITYPDRFRIDFGDLANGNCNIWRNDSIYVIRKNEMVHQGTKIQEFLLLEGGIFAYPIDTVLRRMTQLGLDTNVFRKDKYEGRPVYVIGAKAGDLSVPQVWLDAQQHQVVRRFSQTRDGGLLEVRYADFQQVGDYSIESWLEFYKDGRLLQTERYYDIHITPDIPPANFDPLNYREDAWFNDILGIQANFDRQAACWNKGDHECYMQAYAKDNCQTLSRGGLTRGYKNILGNYQKYYPKEKMGQLHFDEFQYKKLSDRFFYVIGRFNLKSPGQTDLRQGWFSVIMEKINGEWLMISDHSS